MSTSLLGATDTLLRAAVQSLDGIAKKQNVPERIVKAMQFKMDCQMDAMRDQYMLRIAWKDPDGSERRAFTVLVDSQDLGDRERIGELVHMHIEQLNLRGELFYFKLHKHFPNRIKAVNCNSSGRVTVHFNNGRELSVDESALDSVEFLATCGMIYDL